MLTLRYFPKSWKTAVVVPILKPGENLALAESYRPISLLPGLSKLAEKVILARLNDQLEREKILIPEQHGFRLRLSTSHQLLRVVEFIKEGNSKDECTTAVFLDIQKAFDRVSDRGLPVTSSSPVPLKTRRVGQRCTLNLLRVETFSRWCGVVVRRGRCQLRCHPRHLTMVQNYVVRRQKPTRAVEQ
ncbi:RNA-directed DNA polymerase from mobile element jockey [Trichonephila clavipes]|nr:RNA-directed DNA polymerase from mobile element jockey [Trichonephila clavipes]